MYTISVKTNKGKKHKLNSTDKRLQRSNVASKESNYRLKAQIQSSKTDHISTAGDRSPLLNRHYEKVAWTMQMNNHNRKGEIGL